MGKSSSIGNTKSIMELHVQDKRDFRLDLGEKSFMERVSKHGIDLPRAGMGWNSHPWRDFPVDVTLGDTGGLGVAGLDVLKDLFPTIP